MRIFESKEEKNRYDLEELLKKINNQKSIYAVNYNENSQEITYKLVFGLNDIVEKTISLTDKDINDQSTLKLIETILLRFSLLKNKTRENINKILISEYISTFRTNKNPLKINEEIDRKVLLERIKEKKDDIVHFVDEEIGVRVAITTLENIAATSIVSLIDQAITKYLLAYTFIAPFIYSYVPYKIDNIKNTIKYNKVVSSLEKEQYTPRPNLKLFCVVNKKVHELQEEDSRLYATEIKALQNIMEMCYTNGTLEEQTIDIEIVKQIEEVYSRIELKKLNKKTVSFSDYLAKRQTLEIQDSDEIKIAKSR